MRIVENGYKIDLHIHSVYSRVKDAKKVSFNTIDHIGVLANKLNENGVQICAITDHDTFGFDMYKALKSYEACPDYSIIKVLPGIEFSVLFQGDEQVAVVHVVAIFDDTNEEKLSTISSIIMDGTGKPKYDKEMAFSEERFLSILREIDLDTILIAHQKQTLTSTRGPKKSDANSVGPNRFEEFIFTDFFEAYEFKNKRNEIFNKAYLFSSGLDENIRFVTGSDCHDWNEYPKETKRDNSEFIYSYVKCLPTFRGLVMAVTDHRRIKRVNSFFNVAESYLPEIVIELDSKEHRIPLSRGINVIIGDNSIGKSLLLHKLTGYRKRQSGSIKRNLVDSYNRYLRNNKIAIKSEIPADQVFGFDMQGEVREKFEEKKINSDEFLREFYPAPLNPAPYREIVQRELDKVFAYLKAKYEVASMEDGLGWFKIEGFEGTVAESLTFIGGPKKDLKKVQELLGVSSQIANIVEQLRTLRENALMTEEDIKYLFNLEESLLDFGKRFDNRKNQTEIENRLIGVFQTAINSFKTRYNASVSDAQKKLAAYNEGIKQTEDTIVELVVKSRANKMPQIEFTPVKINVETNKVYNYEFNSRLQILEINPEYVWSLFERCFKKENRIEVMEMTQEQLANALLRYDGSETEALDELNKKIMELLDEDLKPRYTITQEGMDKTAELSAGFNAQIYFDLLSYASEKNGIYIIDQPEDNISQRAIREYLLDRFKTMGERRQVIIVTHNPQFIVNLDVDNVVYIGKDESGEIVLQSGALEYKNDEYSMLELISSHIEGGLDTLQRRWKRYEKNISVSE